MVYLRLGLFALLVGSCNPANYPSNVCVAGMTQLTFHADTNFTPAERLDLEKAAENWFVFSSQNAYINVVFDLDWSKDLPENGGYLVRNEAKDEVIAQIDAKAAPGSITLGAATTVRGRKIILLVPERIPPGGFLTIAIHEMGHSLGLAHVTHGIMAGTYDGVNEFSSEDLRECQRVCVCPTKK